MPISAEEENKLASALSSRPVKWEIGCGYYLVNGPVGRLPAAQTLARRNNTVKNKTPPSGPALHYTTAILLYMYVCVCDVSSITCIYHWHTRCGTKPAPHGSNKHTHTHTYTRTYTRTYTHTLESPSLRRPGLVPITYLVYVCLLYYTILAQMLAKV